jgi:hypothetical protein
MQLDSVSDRVLRIVDELTWVAHDLDAFGHDLGIRTECVTWDRSRREQLRCDLDATLFQVYGVSRDDAAYILDTFHIIRRDDVAAFGEYRTKRLILEAYDRLVEQHDAAAFA